MKYPFCFTLGFALCGCVSVPQTSDLGGADKSPRQLLADSAKKHGNRFDRYREVKVSYDGKWSTFPKLTQPVLVDPDFRKTSTEIYRPKQSLVLQTHRGPGGEKKVRRTYRGSTRVSYNGVVSDEKDVNDAAALVAEAYTLFLFGPSYLLEDGSDFTYLGTRKVGGNRCHLVEGTLKPGIGNSPADRVVAWIDAESRLLRRVYFSLEGLEPTRGAEVDVTMDRFVTASDGSVWPTHFVEYVRKPVSAKAHDWRTTALSIDGVAVLE